MKSLLDLDMVNMLRSLDEPDEEASFFGELVNEYAQQAQRALTTIETLIAEHDLASLGKTVHSLKGSSLNVGAQRVGEICQQIEVNVHEHNIEEVARQSGVLHNALNETLNALLELSRQ